MCEKRTDYATVCEKLTDPEYVKDEDRNAIFARGHFIEPVVIRTFAGLVGAKVLPETRMFRSRKNPNMTANIDGILQMPSGNLAVFEAKTAVRGKEGEWMGRRIPVYYVCQCHQYMAVLDDPRIEGAYIGMIPVADVTLDGTYIGSAYNDDFYHHFIERDPVFEEELVYTEKLFWDTYIVNGIKPERSRNAQLDKTVAMRYQPSPLSDPALQPAELAYDEWKTRLDCLVAADKAFSQVKKQLDQSGCRILGAVLNKVEMGGKGYGYYGKGYYGRYYGRYYGNYGEYGHEDKAKN